MTAHLPCDPGRLARRGVVTPLVVAGALAVATGCLGIARLDAAQPVGDDVAVETRPTNQYEPAGFGRGTDYDLRAACEDNARKRAAGQAHNFACFLLADYMAAYHPDAEFAWQQCGGRAFGFVGTRRPDRETLQHVYVAWQSFSDGLQWGFSEVEITRHVGTDPFGIVADDDARVRIRKAVEDDAGPDAMDVFVERTRQVLTDQGGSEVVFPRKGFDAERYGVRAAGRVRFFTLDGEPRDEPEPGRPAQ